MLGRDLHCGASDLLVEVLHLGGWLLRLLRLAARLSGEHERRGELAALVGGDQLGVVDELQFGRLHRVLFLERLVHQSQLRRLLRLLREMLMRRQQDAVLGVVLLREHRDVLRSAGRVRLRQHQLGKAVLVLGEAAGRGRGARWPHLNCALHVVCRKEAGKLCDLCEFQDLNNQDVGKLLQLQRLKI